MQNVLMIMSITNECVNVNAVSMETDTLVNLCHVTNSLTVTQMPDVYFAVRIIISASVILASLAMVFNVQLNRVKF